jgi:hypothetical protein
MLDAGCWMLDAGCWKNIKVKKASGNSEAFFIQ